jgi:hypothetical protein
MLVTRLNIASMRRAGAGATRKQIEIYFQGTCRPTAQTLPLIGRTTAGPVGSSRIKLQRLLAFK